MPVPSRPAHAAAVLSVPDADRLLAHHACCLGSETVALAGAVGRVLRVDVCADRDLPPFDRVAMDGVALRSADVGAGQTRFPVTSAQHAGEAPHTCPPGACVDVTTGSVLPVGADAVVAVERLRVAAGVVELLDADVAAGRAVHVRGSDAPRGRVLVEAGTRLGPAHIAALASVGTDRVEVGMRARVAIVSTGDELVAVGEAVLPHLIRQSNGPALAAMLARCGISGVVPVHARDTPEALTDALGRALASADVVLVTGGVSVGRLDLVPATLAALGVERVFHRIAQRPGKPLWFGVAPATSTGAGTAVFGLPGNPASALTCAVRYVVPFLAAMEGATARPPARVRLDPAPDARPDLTRFVPVRLVAGHAEPVRTSGSGDLVSILSADGVAEVAPGTTSADAPFHAWTP